jgi:hypothetical protein
VEISAARWPTAPSRTSTRSTFAFRNVVDYLGAGNEIAIENR